MLMKIIMRTAVIIIVIDRSFNRCDTIFRNVWLLII